MRRWRWTTANVRMVGGMPGRRVHEGGTPSECGLVSVSRTQGNARPQRADPGLGGATALRLADSEPRRDAPAIGTSTLDLRQSNQPPGLAVTLTAAGARGMEHLDQNQRMHARRACGGCQWTIKRPARVMGVDPRMLCVNVYREDLPTHAARRKANPARTRDLLGRHRAMSQGIVNNLMNHQGVRHALRSGPGPFPGGLGHPPAEHPEMVQAPTQPTSADVAPASRVT